MAETKLVCKLRLLIVSIASLQVAALALTSRHFAD